MKATKSFSGSLLNITYDNRSILIRLVVGFVFLSEGIQKYLFLSLLGPGRFLQIGFSHPAFWSYFTGTFEIVCGALIIFGLLTRLASIPLFIIMVTAFIKTKWPVLINKGFWVFAHEYRADFAMTVLLIYLFIYGSGAWSLDAGMNSQKNT
jgi:putative oxidoreductase